MKEKDGMMLNLRVNRFLIQSGWKDGRRRRAGCDDFVFPSDTALKSLSLFVYWFGSAHVAFVHIAQYYEVTIQKEEWCGVPLRICARSSSSELYESEILLTVRRLVCKQHNPL